MGNNPHSIVSRMKTAQAVTGIDSSGELDIEELDAGTVNVAADSFIFNDADDGKTYEEAIADLVTGVAGTVTSTALSASSGVLSVSPGGATAKTSPVSADSALIRDSEAANVNKSITLANLTKALSPTACTAKTSPVAADELIVGDTEASNVAKKATVANLTKGLSPNALTAKTAPVAADELIVGDTEASNVAKKVTISNLTKGLGISVVTAKTEPITADSVLINDSAASNVAKSCTITNLAKPIGEVVAGTNATSALSEADGVARVNINGTTAKTAPVGADAVLINDSEASNVNKACTLTNLVNMIAGTITATGLDDATGVLTVRPLGATAKTTAVDADGILLGDSADSNKPKTLTWANMKTQLGTDMAGTGLVSSAGVMATEDPGAIAVGSVLFGATGDCTSVSVGAVTYAYDATPVVADGEWAYGVSASESATNLAAAINGKTDSPYTAIANGDTVYIFAEAVGTAGNVSIARAGGTQPATLENLVGGLAAATKQSCVVRHVVTANEVDTAVLVHIPLPFTPTKFIASVTSATGEQKILTDKFTIGATPDRIVLTDNGATHAIATDIITVQAWE